MITKYYRYFDTDWYIARTVTDRQNSYTIQATELWDIKHRKFMSHSPLTGCNWIPISEKEARQLIFKALLAK